MWWWRPHDHIFIRLDKTSEPDGQTDSPRLLQQSASRAIRTRCKQHNNCSRHGMVIVKIKAAHFYRSHCSTNTNHGLSHRYDGSHHHEWDLLWARSTIRERHIRWQIWHSKLLVDGGSDLRRSRLASNSWMHRTSNSSTADLHV